MFLAHVLDGGSGRYKFIVAETKQEAQKYAAEAALEFYKDIHFMYFSEDDDEDKAIKVLEEELTKNYKKAIKLYEEEDIFVEVKGIKKMGVVYEAD